MYHCAKVEGKKERSERTCSDTVRGSGTHQVGTVPADCHLVGLPVVTQSGDRVHTRWVQYLLIVTWSVYL